MSLLAWLLALEVLHVLLWCVLLFAGGVAVVWLVLKIAKRCGLPIGGLSNIEGDDDE